MDPEQCLAALAGVVTGLAQEAEASGSLAALKTANDAFGGAAGMRTHVQRACEAAHQLLLRAEAQRAKAADGGDEADGGGNAAERLRARANAGLQVLFYLQQALGASDLVGRLLRETAPLLALDGGSDDVVVPEVKDDELVAGIARFAGLDLEDTNKTQHLLLYLLTCAQERRYRRGPSADGSTVDLHQRVLSPHGGHDTHAWERACTIRDFVYDVTRKEVKYDMWLALTAVRGNMASIVEHLAYCHDVQLPDLVKDRHVFSFANGIYLAKTDRFVRYGSPEAARLPADLVAATYFPDDFPEALWAGDGGSGAAAELPTPHLQSIMDFQKMSPEVCRWLYVMIGRLIYEVNELDGWQVIPYLKGVASSGKSTVIMRVCRGLYEPGDVGVMSNNIERKFGLSALADKLLFVGPEIKGDCQIEQAEFQSIVSGEVVQVATKFKTAQSVDWRVPGILAGNEVPGWVDNAGSINRRIMLFDFPHQVHQGDMELGKKIDRELPTIILKANRAYIEAARAYGRQNVWRHVPQEMITAKEEFSETVNSIVAFLKSGRLQVAESLYMPLYEFSQAYASYIQDTGMQRIQLAGDKLRQPLFNLGGCRVVKKMTLRYGGSMRTGEFIKGLDFAEAPADSSNNANANADPLGDFSFA